MYSQYDKKKIIKQKTFWYFGNTKKKSCIIIFFFFPKETYHICVFGAVPILFFKFKNYFNEPVHDLNCLNLHKSVSMERQKVWHRALIRWKIYHILFRIIKKKSSIIFSFLFFFKRHTCIVLVFFELFQFFFV